MNSPIYNKNQIMIDPFCPSFPPLQVRLMPRKKVGEGFALVGRDTGPGKDCLWYGTTFCDGDLVEDLYRWWLKQKHYLKSIIFTDGGSRWSAPSPSSPLPVFLILKWFRIQDLNPSLKYCNVFFCGKYIFIFWRNCWRCALGQIPCLMKRQSNHSTIICNLSCLENIINTYI